MSHGALQEFPDTDPITLNVRCHKIRFEGKVETDFQEMAVSIRIKSNISRQIASTMFSYFYELICMGGPIL